MAVASVNIFKIAHIFIIYFLSSCIYALRNIPEQNDVDTIIRQLKSSCVILMESTISTRNPTLFGKMMQLLPIFEDEPLVNVHIFKISEFIWPNGQHLQFDKYGDYEDLSNMNDIHTNIALLPKQKADRTCLMNPVFEWYPKAEALIGIEDINTVLDLINNRCDTFQTANGLLNAAGQHRQAILNNLFSAESVSHLTMKTLQGLGYQKRSTSTHERGKGFNENCDALTADGKSCDFATVGNENYVSPFQSYSNMTRHYNGVLPQCEKIPLSKLDWQNFFEGYVSKSKPVIIANATREWTAFKKWTTDFLRREYGQENVHVKLTPGGDFEGVEPAILWEDYDSFEIPQQVKAKLKFPDLVVVRPAATNMNFSDFLDLITWAASQKTRNVSAYLEYSSIPDNLPGLEEDIKEFHFVKGRIKRRHLNIWLSDGNTLGRLHFDPYDNLLCQLKGKKEVILFEPHDNRKLYEAHIPQATLKYNKHLKQFRRKGLEDSTSMVMSPVDIQNPDFERFPLFGDTMPLNCTIDEGDVLFMPSFWWHEVYSWPNREEKRNLAVNFWYEPFLVKEFPCADCKLDINPFYRHLL